MNNKRILIFGCIAILFVVLIFGVIKFNKNGKSNEGQSSEVEMTAEIITTEHILTTEVTDEEETTVFEVTESSVEPATTTEIGTVMETETKPISTEKATMEKETQKPTETAIPTTVEKTTETESQTTTEKEKETETLPKPTTAVETTTVETTTAKVPLSEEVNSTEFSFVTYKISEMANNYRWDKYLLSHGYIKIDSLEALREASRKMLDEMEEQKAQIYILTSRNAFDDIANELEQLNSLAVSEPTSINLNKRDEFLFNKLGINYQYYYSRGYSIFKIKKIQDVVNAVNNYSVYVVYSYSYENMAQRQKVTEAVGKIIKNFTGSDYDKAKAAHDYLCDKVQYCNDETVPLLAHTAYGALINGISVCDGYAKAYKLLLEAMGIDCEIVINSVHGWNEVCLEGEWYLVDVTNDDSNSATCYFLLGKDVMYSDENKIVDGFVFDEETNKQISYYNYKDGKNTSKNSLADTSYDWENRIK